MGGRRERGRGWQRSRVVEVTVGLGEKRMHGECHEIWLGDSSEARSWERREELVCWNWSLWTQWLAWPAGGSRLIPDRILAFVNMVTVSGSINASLLRISLLLSVVQLCANSWSLLSTAWVWKMWAACVTFIRRGERAVHDGLFCFLHLFKLSLIYSFQYWFSSLTLPTKTTCLSAACRPQLRTKGTAAESTSGQTVNALLSKVTKLNMNSFKCGWKWKWIFFHPPAYKEREDKTVYARYVEKCYWGKV